MTTLITELEYDKIWGNGNLVLYDEIKGVDIRNFITTFLMKVEIQYILYGSNDQLKYDVEMHSDYDIYTPFPLQFFNMLAEDLITVYPGLIICGKSAIHDGTYRLRVNEITFVDLTFIAVDAFKRLYELLPRLENTAAGKTLNDKQNVCVTSAILLKPYFQFLKDPFFCHKDGEKFKKAKDFIKEKFVPSSESLHHKQCKNKAIYSPFRITHFNKTYSGKIAIAVWECMLGIGDTEIITISDKEITLKTVCGMNPITYFTCCDLIKKENSDFTYKFGPNMPHCMYAKKYKTLLYHTEHLPTNIYWHECTIGNHKIYIASPEFLLYELFNLLLLPIDFNEFFQDCSPDHMYDRLYHIYFNVHKCDTTRLINIMQKDAQLGVLYPTKYLINQKKLEELDQETKFMTSKKITSHSAIYQKALINNTWLLKFVD